MLFTATQKRTSTQKTATHAKSEQFWPLLLLTLFPLWPLAHASAQHVLDQLLKDMFLTAWANSLHLLAPISIGSLELLDCGHFLLVHDVFPKLLWSGLCPCCFGMIQLVLLSVCIERVLDELEQHQLILVLRRPAASKCPCCASGHPRCTSCLFSGQAALHWCCTLHG